MVQQNVHSQESETKLHPDQNQREDNEGQQNNPISNQIQDTAGNKISLQEKTEPQPTNVPTTSRRSSNFWRYVAACSEINK